MSSNNILTRTRCANAKTYGRFSAPVNNERKKPDNDQEADKDQTEFLRNEFCARLSDIRKESREQRADEGGSGRNNPLAHRAYGEKPARSNRRGDRH